MKWYYVLIILILFAGIGFMLGNSVGIYFGPSFVGRRNAELAGIVCGAAGLVLMDGYAAWTIRLSCRQKTTAAKGPSRFDRLLARALLLVFGSACVLTGIGMVMGGIVVSMHDAPDKYYSSPGGMSSYRWKEGGPISSEMWLVGIFGVLILLAAGGGMIHAAFGRDLLKKKTDGGEARSTPRADQ